MPCNRSPGGCLLPGGGLVRGVSSRGMPAPGGGWSRAMPGRGVGVCSQGVVSQHVLRQIPRPVDMATAVDAYHWNAFLFNLQFIRINTSIRVLL